MKRIISSLFAILVLSAAVTLAPPTQQTGLIVHASPNIKIGQFIKMGNYYGEPILWRCINIDGNGPLILADSILTLKSFDASGSHYYLNGDYQLDSPVRNDKNVDTNEPLYANRERTGSNLWETSTLRAWLNSSAIAGEVEWLGGVRPDSESVRYGENAYDNEAGFLSSENFSDEEVSVIKSVSQKVILNQLDVSALSANGSVVHKWKPDSKSFLQNYTSAYSYNVRDRMFLLDLKQLYLMKTNPVLGGEYYKAIPSQSAVDNSGYPTDENTIINSYTYRHYWLRDPQGSGNCPDLVRDVMKKGNIGGFFAFDSGAGVRPAFYLDIENSVFLNGKGNRSNPYVVSSSSMAPTAEPTLSTNTMPPNPGGGGMVTNPPLVVAPVNPSSQESNDSTMWLIIGIGAIVLILIAAGILLFILFKKDKRKPGIGPSPLARTYSPSGPPVAPSIPSSAAPFGEVPPPTGAPYGSVAPRPVAPPPAMNNSIWNENEQQSISQYATVQKCLNCHSKMLPDSKFCTKCGFDNTGASESAK